MHFVLDKWTRTYEYFRDYEAARDWVNDAPNRELWDRISDLELRLDGLFELLEVAFGLEE